VQSVSAFRQQFLAAWRTHGNIGDPPYRHDWPPHMMTGDPTDPHPTHHEERLSAIAEINRRDSEAGAVAKRCDFLRLGRRRTAQLLGITERTVARRRLRFWTALQAHMCGTGCEGCTEACRRA
jgi:hypothetical protein